MPLQQLVIGGISLLLLAAGAVQLVRARRTWTGCSRVIGEVVRHEGRGRSDWSPVVRYRWQGVQSEFVSDVGAAAGARLAVGSQVPLLVDPDDPHVVRDGRPGYFWLRSSTPFCVGCVGLAAVCFWT